MIGFTNNERGQAREPVGDEEVIAYLADKPVVLNDNGLLFKNNVEYAWAKIMQDSKITKVSMGIFFNNPDLAPMREHLSYKNGDEMRALLTELSYGKVTWWTKSISIRSVIADVTPKEYLMYYLDIKPAIRFLIGHRPFAQRMAYEPVQSYSTDNPKNPEVDGEDEQIYGEMHTADWWWTTQKAFIDSGVQNATVIRVLLAKDKTVLT